MQNSYFLDSLLVELTSGPTEELGMDGHQANHR